jgi:hypothetical protein
MSRVLAALLVLTVAASAAHAQGPARGIAETRRLLARADSLEAQLAWRDSVARQQTYAVRLARPFEAGPLVTLLPAAVGEETGQRIATGARDALDGAVPDAFVRTHVVVAAAAAGVDSVLRASGLASRATVTAVVPPRPDSFADGTPVAGALAAAYRETLDTTWRAWLPFVLPVRWTMLRDGRGAVRELMGSDTRTGAECLGGSVVGCRLWLGLDADTNPYRSRYRPDELRRMIASRSFVWSYSTGLVGACTAGSDEACVDAAARGLLSAVPAGLESRGSLLTFVRNRRPRGALVEAFADSTGAVGERLARAAGMPEDSLVRAWRIWLLTGGGLPRVTADVRDALPVVLFTGLLLLAAARSGRWR